MHRFAPIWFTLSAVVALAADPGDPKSLAVPAEKTKAAAELIAKLDDDDILVRDRLTGKLKAMGRDALPAIEAALKAKPADRVTDRLVELLPAARKADFDARAACFLADKERKFDHDLLGWNELKAAVKDTKESRLLMADILGDGECRDMLLRAKDTTSAGRKVFVRRWLSKSDLWSAEDRANLLAGRPRRGPCPPADGPIHWMPAALLADLLYGRDYQDDSRHDVVLKYLETDEGKLAAAGKGRYGEVVRTFATDWVARQDGRWGMRDAHLIAFYFKLEEEVIRGVLEKQFEAMVTSGKVNTSIGSLALTRDSKYVTSFRRLFESSQVFSYHNERSGVDTTDPKILVRDAALSMCVALSGQDPVDYGFSAEVPADAKSDMRFQPHNYFFEGEDVKAVDEKRTAAFKKWAEWEKANPDKLKIKPPEKKEK